MSVLICPNSSCGLLRAAARSLLSKRSERQASIAARWLSGSAGQAQSATVLSPPRRISWQQTAVRRSPGPQSSKLPVPGHGRRRTLFSSSRKVIRNYEELPRDYRDQAGIAFGRTDLTEAEVRQLFGPEISVAAANHLLRILHGRRVAGTLDDPAFAMHTAQYTVEQMAAGLAFLRRTVPTDEIMNAGLRAEDELDKLEQAEQNRKRARGAQEAAETATDVYKPDPVYGRSKLDEIRSRNIARQRAEEKALEEERQAATARLGTAAAGPVAKLTGQTREITNPKIAEYYKKAQSDLKAPPEMKAWERILPSLTVVVVVLGGLAAVSMVYEEPMPRYRLLKEVTASQATLGAIIALNVLVFLGWRVPQLWAFFNRYMIMVVATVKPVMLFSAINSHQSFKHLLLNMTGLWFVGNNLHDEMGRAKFLTLYLGCGAMGFLGSLVTYTLRGWLTVTVMGASGATLGLLSAYFWEHRMDGFKMFGLPENGVHGIVFLALLVAGQVVGAMRKGNSKIDVVSHVAGMVAGVLGIELVNGTWRRGGGGGDEQSPAGGDDGTDGAPKGAGDDC